jgi:hypothetical protein
LINESSRENPEVVAKHDKTIKPVENQLGKRIDETMEGYEKNSL